MEETVKILALGGLDEAGKDCYLVDVSGELYVIGCGLRYPDKTMPGVDYVIPDCTYLIENKSRLKAYFLLHGHEDELGGLVYLYENAPAPIYGSDVTLAMLRLFAEKAGKGNVSFDLRPVEPTSTFKVGDRTCHFFQTAHSIARSSGLAIDTKLGHVVFTGDFVVENSADPNYLHDINAIARLAETPTLVLLSESGYAEKPGYTAPRHRLSHHVESAVKDAPGRTFAALFSSNYFNIEELIRIARETRKKIIPYDQETSSLLKAAQEVGQLQIPKENFAPYEDLNRLRDQDVLVLLLGSGRDLFGKIALLAAGTNETHKCYLRESDLFLMAAPGSDNTEIEATDALDELYRSGCHVISLSKKDLLRMHASEEDLRMMAALLKPRFYLPVKGFYKDLLANARLISTMGIGLTHRNIIILDDGITAIFDRTGVRTMDEGVPHGNLLIDGIGIGDVGREVIKDREKLSGGAILIGITVSRKRKAVLAGPEIEMRGLAYLKETEPIRREIAKIAETALQEGLRKSVPDLNAIKGEIYDKSVRYLRGRCQMEPMILPLLVEVA